jgi:hypothetical protein
MKACAGQKWPTPYFSRNWNNEKHERSKRSVARDKSPSLLAAFRRVQTKSLWPKTTPTAIR